MTITLISVYVPIGLQGGFNRHFIPRICHHTCRCRNHFRHCGHYPLAYVGVAIIKTHKTIEAPLAKLFDRFQAYYSRKLNGVLRSRSGVYVFWCLFRQPVSPCF